MRLHLLVTRQKYTSLAALILKIVPIIRLFNFLPAAQNQNLVSGLKAALPDLFNQRISPSGGKQLIVNVLLTCTDLCLSGHTTGE